MQNLNTEPQWKIWEKFTFRFLFLFLGFFLLNYELVSFFDTFYLFNKLSLIYGLFVKPLHWLDQHFYHTGYNPKLHSNFPSDNHYGLIFYISIVILFLFLASAWSIIDKHKPNYNKLYYWFRIYIRYMVALIMIWYGIDKLIPIQMSYPDVTDLLKPMGEQDLFSILWNFVGISPGYEIFVGSCELIGSFLLIFRRTYIFGALFMCTVLCNVVALNTFYNISVKLYSALLLISVIFLLLPFFNKLKLFFFYNRKISLEELKYPIVTSWKRYFFIGLGVLMVGGTIVFSILKENKVYRMELTNKKHQRLYNIAWFVTKDTIPPILSDTLRWKRFALIDRHTAVIYNMKDSAGSYDYDLDSNRHLYTLHDNTDSSKWDKLLFSYPQKNKFEFSGKWKGIDVHIMMEEVLIDSMKLNKERIVFVQN
jgi:hypothetical protein